MSDATDRSADIRVVAGSPSDEEAAAIAVVLQQVGLEHAASSLPLPADPRHGRWVPAGGAVRRPLDRASGWHGGV